MAATVTLLERAPALQRVQDALRESLSVSSQRENELDLESARLEEELAATLAATESAAEQEEESLAAKKSLEVAMESLNSQIEHLKSVYQSRTDTQAALSKEIEELKAALSAGPGWTESQEEERRQLAEEVRGLQEQLRDAVDESSTQSNAVEEATSILEGEEKGLASLHENLQELETTIAHFLEEGRKEGLRRDEAEASLAGSQEALRSVQAQCRENQGRLRQAREHMATTEKILQQSKEGVESYLVQYGTLYQTIQGLDRDVNREKESNIQTEAGIKATRERTAMAAEQIAECARERSKLTQLRDLVIKKTQDMEVERKNLEAKQESLRAQAYQLTAVEARAEQNMGNLLTRQAVELRHEIGILERKLDASAKAMHLIDGLRRAKESAKSNLAAEVSCFEASIRQKRASAANIGASLEALEKELRASNLEHARWQKRLHEQEEEEIVIKKKMGEDQDRIKQKKNIYEAVRSDRNAYSRSLISIQEEIKAMKRNFKIVNQQIEQYKDEISAKDRTLVREHFLYHNSEKEREAMGNELSKTHKRVSTSEDIGSGQRSEVQKLNKITSEAEDEHRRQQKELKAIVQEQEALTRQLQARHEELKVVYEKIRVQTSALYQGEVRYQKLHFESHALDRQLVTERDAVEKALASASIATDLPAREIELRTALLAEQAKVKALSDELEIPLNIHRWRQLESSDPERYTLICRLQSLHQRLLAKRESIIQKEKTIMERNAHCEKLQALLCRQPGPQAAKQLQEYQEALKNKAKQMHGIEEELALYRDQVEAFKTDLTELAVARDRLQEEWLTEVLHENGEEEFGEEEQAHHAPGSYPAAAAVLVAQ